jgi:hypothetical protein
MWLVFSRIVWFQHPSRVPQAREPEVGLTDGDHRPLCDVYYFAAIWEWDSTVLSNLLMSWPLPMSVILLY